jgi:hypothetical protein
MEQWSVEQSAYAIKLFYKNNDSYVTAQRSFIRLHFNLKRHDSVPSARLFKYGLPTFKNRVQH